MSPPFEVWHNFFMLVGTAAATLIGAMFVVVSIGLGFLTQDRSASIHAFLTSTVTHLSTALLGALLSVVPELDWSWFGATVGVIGLGGAGYSAYLALGFHQHPNTVPSDWWWYAIVPLVGYLLLLAVAATALAQMTISVGLFAAALALMLLAGIRNAWDMILFLVTRNRASG